MASLALIALNNIILMKHFERSSPSKLFPDSHDSENFSPFLPSRLLISLGLSLQLQFSLDSPLNPKLRTSTAGEDGR